MSTMSRAAVALEGVLYLRRGTDARAPGGEVTVALCGSWEHDGPCRWPDNTHIDVELEPARLRTVVVVPDDEREQVLVLIETALCGDPRWTVCSIGTGPITADEHELSRRLARVH
jgi:hypothetical protein